jgi:hypothetical protein
MNKCETGTLREASKEKSLKAQAGELELFLCQSYPGKISEW